LVGQVVYNETVPTSGRNKVELTLPELANGQYVVKDGNSTNIIQIKNKKIILMRSLQIC